MGGDDQLAERFEAHRSHLRGVAYRMLGSLSEADDAVQETWFRLARSDVSAIDNLAGWLTRVVARICLDMLRQRTSRREQPLPDRNLHRERRPASPTVQISPEEEALLADSVGLALLVVLDRLGPAERVAFVLHDLFAVPFDDIAPIVERTPTTTKKLASRARQRINGTATIPDADLSRQRKVVGAFLAATRDGDLRALLAVLDPDVVRRADSAALPKGAAMVLRGARDVAEESRTNVARARLAATALVDGRVGLVVAPRGRLLLVIAVTIEDDKVTELDVVADRTRLDQVEIAALP